jgi:hypothetical protein
MPIALTTSSSERGHDAMHVGLLHDRGERLLGEPAGLQEGREVAAFARSLGMRRPTLPARVSHSRSR